MISADVQLRHACAADTDRIVALERATPGAPHWPPAAYDAIVAAQSVGNRQAATPQRCLFVAEQMATEFRGAIVGFAVGLMHPADAFAELETIVVANSARRLGIGRTLCAAVLDWCRERGAASIVLEVRASSAAVALYAGIGFVLEGRRPHYYRDPDDDALILRLQLSGSLSKFDDNA